MQLYFYDTTCVTEMLIHVLQRILTQHGVFVFALLTNVAKLKGLG